MKFCVFGGFLFLGGCMALVAACFGMEWIERLIVCRCRSILESGPLSLDYCLDSTACGEGTIPTGCEKIKS